jgi:alkylation response protein AidB-like acyl-CoA dehydrogenase
VPNDPTTEQIVRGYTEAIASRELERVWAFYDDGIVYEDVAVLEAVEAALTVHGGNSVAHEYQLATYFWIVRMLNNGRVSKEMILNVTAEHALGLPRSY